MTDEKNDKISNLCYFLAGTLLPTLAYAFLLRQKKRKRNSNTSSSDSEEDDDSSGDEFEPILMRVGDKDHPKSWGMADAPYKVGMYAGIYASVSIVFVGIVCME